MKFPLWLRVLLAPIRLILFFPAVTISVLLSFIGEENKGDDIVGFVCDFGNEEM